MLVKSEGVAAEPTLHTDIEDVDDATLQATLQAHCGGGGGSPLAGSPDEEDPPNWFTEKDETTDTEPSDLN